MSYLSPLVASLAVVTMSVGAAMPAGAQTAKPRAWAVEVHGGLAIGATPSGGTIVGEFPTGPPLSTAGSPTRLVPSWYFGDGSQLFNEVGDSFAALHNQQLPRLTALDATLHSAAARRHGGGIFGVRLTRRLTSRLDLEFGIGVTQGTFELTDEARQAFEDTRVSFQNAFTALFTDLTPQTNLRVTSEVEVDENRVRQTLLSGGINFWLSRNGRMHTYLSGGLGRIVNGGGTPEVRLRGNYQLRFLAEFPFNESDSVTVSFVERENAFVGLVGGGVTYAIGSRQGIRGDVRVQLSGNRIETIVDAASTRLLGAPALFLPTNTSPSIQFSNVSGVSSSLSGRLTELTTFVNDGLDTRILMTVGYFVRF